MKKWNPSSPWNPTYSVNVTPKEYELQVVEWLKSTAESLTNFEVNHLQHLSGSGGEYEFDAIAEFTIFDGAQITVLIECKRYNRPVERDHIMTLWAKQQDVNANKCMIFSTCGFQSGAIEYAENKHIATITFVDGSILYETKSYHGKTTTTTPPWVELPRFAGIITKYNHGAIHCSTIDNKNTEIIRGWLLEKINIQP